MLDALEAVARQRDLRVTRVDGRWPDVADRVPAATSSCARTSSTTSPTSAPFAVALSAHATKRVVVELNTAHPWVDLGPLWQRVHHQPRPAGPTADLAVEVLREHGIEPSRQEWVRPAPTSSRARPSRRTSASPAAGCACPWNGSRRSPPTSPSTHRKGDRRSCSGGTREPPVPRSRSCSPTSRRSQASADYRRLWFGSTVSQLGQQMTAVAVAIQVYALTQSSFSVGLVGLFAFVPLVGFGLYGGAIADAFDRRKLSLLSSTGLWVLSIALALQAFLHVDSVALLYAIVAVQAACFAVNSPARSAIIPRLLPPEMLPAANALSAASMNLGFTVGPLLGGVVYGWSGPAAAYTHRLRDVHGRALRAVAAAAGAAAGRGAAGRAGLGARGAALSAHPAQRADDLPRRHVRDGARPAARAVPGHRDLVLRRRHPHGGPARRVSGDGRAASPSQPRAGSGASAGRGWR